MDPQQIKSQIAWYKTTPGKIFISVLAIIFIISFFFLALISYYFWNIKYGDAEKLAKEFSSDQFTIGSDLSQYSTGNINTVIINKIHEYNPTLGNSESNINILMFIDFECPYCQANYAIYNNIMQKYNNAINFVFKQFPLESIHPNAIKPAIASSCANEQDSFWNYYHLIFQNKKTDSASLRGYAQELNLDQQKFDLCLNNPKIIKQIEQDLKDGVELGVTGTPTFFINKTKVEGIAEEEAWDEILITEIQKSYQN